jgi:two-component system cell cycle sensor histidine kinase/response regulator CckA
MNPEKQPLPASAAAKGVGKISNGLIIAISLLSFLGWLTGMPLLTSWGDSYKPMAISSTFLFLLFSTLLLLGTIKLQWPLLRGLMPMASLAAIGHSIWVIFHSGSPRAIVDHVLAKSQLTYLKEYAGHMSPLTAVGWMVASLSLMQFVNPIKGRWARIASDIPALVLFFFGFTYMIGYLYGMPFLYGSMINPPALPTACMFMLLALSLLIHNSANSVILGLFFGPSIQSRLLRIFLPFMVLLMTVTGWFFSGFPPYISGMNPAIMGSLSTTGVLLFTGILIAIMSRLVGRDIDIAQEKVSKSEKRYRELIENVNEVIFSIDTTGVIEYISPAITRISGYSPEEITGRNFFNFFSKDERVRYDEQMQRTADAGNGSGEYSIKVKDKSTRWISTSSRCVAENGKVVGIRGIMSDVTERKQAEQNLQLIRERLEEAQSITQIGNWEANLVSGELYWSEVIFAIFGFEPKSFKPSVKAFYEGVHPDDRNSVLESETRSEQTGLHDVVHRIIRPNGEIRFVHELARRHTDSQGNLIMLRGTVQDVTERKHAEEQIVRQNKFLLDVLNSLTHPFYVIDAATYRIILANPAATLNNKDENSTCYNLTHGLNSPCNTSHHPCPLLEVKKCKKAVTVEHIHFDDNHKPRNFEIHAYPIFNDAGDVSQIIEYNIDVTDRLLAQERYRSIFENAAEGIFQSTPEGRFISVNHAFAEMYGYGSPQEVIVAIEDIGAQMYVNAKQQEEILENLWKQGRVKNFETRHYRKEGSVIWVSINIHVCRNRADNPLFFEGTCQDITERKKLEAQLLQSQKMEAVGKLAGGIAHDFNNLLTSIIGNTELLIYKRKKKDDTSQRLNTIRETADRAAQLTRQLLMLSRRQASHSIILNLNEVVTSMQRMLERILGEDIQCRFSLEPDLRAIKADAMKIEQVILNLIVNSRQAMPQGGVLDIQTANVPAGTVAIPPGVETSTTEFVMIKITDSGIGIPHEVLKEIFEPFFTTKAGGTGLGLSIVFSIVKQSGGFIEVISEIGKGTSILIHFPALNEGAACQNKKAMPQEEPLPKGTETILIVEDDTQILEMVQTLLLDLNYNILAARCGEDALEIIEKEGEKIDLLFTDIVLPGIHGGQVAELIKRKVQKIKILFTSGYQDERIALTKIITGPISFIQKPFKPSALALKIRRILDDSDTA